MKPKYAFAVATISLALLLFLFATGGGSAPMTAVQESTSSPRSTTPSVSFIVVGNSESAVYPVTNGSRYQTGGDAQNGIFSILTHNSGSTFLTFSTYLGGSAGRGGTMLRSLWVDRPSGDIFIGGRTTAGTKFPTTPGVFQPNYGGGPDDAVICRFSSSGLKKWCSYLGTDLPNIEETVYGIAGLDSSGDLVVCGAMNQMRNGTILDGVRVDKYGSTPSRGNMGYTAKVKGNGTKLLWFTAWSGDSPGGNDKCVLDSNGNTYSEGTTAGSGFPVTSEVFQPINRNSGENQGTIVKVSPSGSLLWASYIGGAGTSGYADPAEGGLAVDAYGNLYTLWGTTAADFFGCCDSATGYQPTLPERQVRAGCAIAHVKSDGSAILNSTFLAGTTYTSNSSASRLHYGWCDAITLDSSGNVVVAGTTPYSDFPVTPGAFQPKNKRFNVFVSKLSPDLSRLVASTFLGGTGWEAQDHSSESLQIDSAGNIWGMAHTSSPDFPVTSGQCQRGFQGQGYVIAIYALNPTLTSEVYGTFLAGFTPVSGGITSNNFPWHGTWAWGFALAPAANPPGRACSVGSPLSNQNQTGP